MLRGSGFINLIWMLVGIWIGLFLARALPQHGRAVSTSVGHAISQDP
jgi:hypothetical protein